MKIKLSSLKKLSSRRWRSKRNTGPLTVTSISLAGSCFSDEMNRYFAPKNDHCAELHLTGAITCNSLTNSLASVYSSELEMGHSGSEASSPSSASTSRSSSMLTTSSTSSTSDCSPFSLSEVYLPYLDEDDDEQADDQTPFVGKNPLASGRPMTIHLA